MRECAVDETGAEPDDMEEKETDKPEKKGPSRNARRKKHKRQLKRLGLLGSPAGTSGSPNKDQAGVPQGACAQIVEDASQAKQMRLQDAAR